MRHTAIVLLTLVVAGSAMAAPAPPGSARQVLAWPRGSGPWRVQVPGDPASPRAFIGSTGPKFGVRSFDGAVADVAKDGGIAFVARPALEPLEAWKRFDGRDNRIGLGRTVLAGRPGVIFFEISRKPGSDLYSVFAVEMPEPVFRAWGGVVRMMVLRELIPTIDSVPARRREQVARGSLAQQVAFFEAAQDKQFEALAAGASIAQQAGVLLRMQELNYDLLFGNDITDPMIGTTRKRGN